MNTDSYNKIEKARKELGLTRRDIAAKLGISESHFSLIMHGKRRMSMDMGLQLASILKKTPNEIFLPNDFAKCKKCKSTA